MGRYGSTWYLKKPITPGQQGVTSFYHNKDKAILYRFDAENKELREFVYIKEASSLSSTLGREGRVVQWRFEGADLALREDGSIALFHRMDPIGKIRTVADNDMATRIRNFFAKRRGKQFPEGPVDKILFIIPAPVYVDGGMKTQTAEVRYKVFDEKLTLLLDRRADLLFPLWVDPTLRADAYENVILNGQSDSDEFGYSVASAGDFNGDGKGDVIVSAPLGSNFYGSAFIFSHHIPTMTEWVIIIFTILILLSGIGMLRKKKDNTTEDAIP